jgi:hypothetical protein
MKVLFFQIPQKIGRKFIKKQGREIIKVSLIFIKKIDELRMK